MQSIIEAARKLPDPARSILRAVYRAFRKRRLEISSGAGDIVAGRGSIYRSDTHVEVIYRDDTRVELQDCGAGRSYVKTFGFPGKCISDFHSQLAAAPLGRMGVPFCIDLGVDGFLARDEAMKLYELAFFAQGDVLELGTFKGLSTSIIARALNDRQGGALVTCDIDPDFSAAASQHVRSAPGGDRVSFLVGDAPQLIDGLIADGRKFGFVFVDHWHGYEATHAAAVRLQHVLAPGGFVLFHDYNDPDTLNPDHHHKVYQAVRDTITNDPAFRFCCVTASSAAFRYCPPN